MGITITLTDEQAVAAKDDFYIAYFAHRTQAAEAAKIQYCDELVKLNHERADESLAAIELINLAIQRKDHP